MLSQEEIDSLLSSLSTSGAPAATGTAVATPLANTNVSLGASASQQEASQSSLEAILKQEKLKNYKIYNFKRPDKFSKDHLRALQTIHENFARQLGMLLTTYLRLSVEVDVVSVDQLTYDEFIKSMPRPISVAILEFEPLPGQLLLGTSYEITAGMVDRMLGGSGVISSKPREFTDTESSLVTRLMERVLKVLEESWRGMMDVSIAMRGLEDNYSMVQITSPGEIVALVTLEVTLNNKDSGLMSLCIPYPVLEEVLQQLSNQHIFHRQQELQPHEQEHILHKMRFAHLPISVLLGGGSITLGELLGLDEGDVIALEREAGQEMLLCVNQEPKFYCRPGTLKNQLAVRLTEPIPTVEALTGFGLPSCHDEEERFIPPSTLGDIASQ